ncbi:MAG: Rrf2 family transcriptional regulator [Phycisphaerales bacterium]|nr:MAG: Rrf2 family transcriptional regulator [Phycisphaerales bacterium]
MEVVRRNTDYSLRAMLNLARHYNDGPVSTRKVAAEEDVSYQLACKLMQRLHDAKLVESSMGPKGGFRLSREPSRINVLQIIEAIQGPLSLNKCLLNADACSRQSHCAVNERLAELQETMDVYLGGITLEELCNGHNGQKE